MMLTTKLSFWISIEKEKKRKEEKKTQTFPPKLNVNDIASNMGTYLFATSDRKKKILSISYTNKKTDQLFILEVCGACVIFGYQQW